MNDSPLRSTSLFYHSVLVPNAFFYRMRFFASWSVERKMNKNTPRPGRHHCREEACELRVEAGDA